MGDHRMRIKINAEFHGKKKDADMYINYFPDEESGIDRRVVDFFKELEAEGMEVYEEIMRKHYEEKNAERIKQIELGELKRLKKKYENKQ